MSLGTILSRFGRTFAHSKISALALVCHSFQSVSRSVGDEHIDRSDLS
jgi:hypothetical protein